MRILVIGGSGMLGVDLRNELWLRGHEVVHPSHADLDLTDPMSSGRILAGEHGQFDVCFNCAAYTAVDKAETDRRAATELNVIGPGYLANACAGTGARLVHISTDFVFDGEKDGPYSEDDPVHPLGVYGKTKADGEREVLQGHFNSLVVRTAWLYGAHGNCFPKTMIRALKAGKQLRVVADQVGCPTNTVDLSRVLVDLAELDPAPGIYHAVGPQAMSWFEFAQLALKTYVEMRSVDLPIQVEPIASDEWPTPAKRPKNSVLSTAKLSSLGVHPMRPVEEALQELVCSIEE